MTSILRRVEGVEEDKNRNQERRIKFVIPGRHDGVAYTSPDTDFDLVEKIREGSLAYVTSLPLRVRVEYTDGNQKAETWGLKMAMEGGFDYVLVEYIRDVPKSHPTPEREYMANFYVERKR